jgi:hypothetical protein
MIPSKDVKELLIQAQISDRAHRIAQEDLTIGIQGFDARYQYALGKLYVDKIRSGKYANEIEAEVYIRAEDVYSYLKAKVRLGKNVVVVAHSQGNYLVEAALAIMHYKDEEDIVRHIRVVGVAPVASTTPSGTYLSHTDDRAVNLHRGQTAGLQHFSVLPVNINACIANKDSGSCDELKRLSDTDWTAHGFVSVYLNPNILDRNGTSLPQKIRDYIDLHSASLSKESTYVERRILKPEKPIETVSKELPNATPYKVTVAARWSRGVFGMMFMAQEPSTTVAKYTWDFGDGHVESRTTPTASHTFNPDGTYRVTLAVTFRDGRTSVCSKTFVMDDSFSSHRYDSSKNQTPCE